MKTHTCDICSKPIGVGFLMCTAHWRQVPKPMQDAVWRTWGRVQRRKGTHQEQLETIRQYRIARDAAVNHVRAQQAEKEAPHV